MLRKQTLLVTCVLLCAAWLMSACAAEERRRPLAVGDVASGPQSLEAVRRQLQGKWTLVSFETFTAPGQAVKHDAKGELTYDEYGNMAIRGALVGESAQPSVLSYKGRAVIDVTNHRLVLQDLEGKGADALPTQVLPEQARYYEFDSGLLKLSVKDNNGQPTALITWKKTQ